MPQKQLYYFSAEHISYAKGTRLVKELETKGVEVESAGMDPVFSDTFRMIITATEQGAKEVRDRLWKENNGACCDMYVTTDTELSAI